MNMESTILWNNHDEHDKVYGVVIAEDAVYAAWGRRGNKKMQTQEKKGNKAQWRSWNRTPEGISDEWVSAKLKKGYRILKEGEPEYEPVLRTVEEAILDKFGQVIVMKTLKAL